jgi:hypothetical protein
MAEARENSERGYGCKIRVAEETTRWVVSCCKVGRLVLPLLGVKACAGNRRDRARSRVRSHSLSLASAWLSLGLSLGLSQLRQLNQQSRWLLS